ncbi:hypothetical protein MNBD_NITROSPINAE02-55 [hydrothermal vent metagenome]|uniref:Negative regulator of flagellin synthesis n=1 Tax=hydrothermal vent metagenome TaxID=652676 RepID=A0A3B1BVH4_9ZZZZ
MKVSGPDQNFNQAKIDEIRNRGKNAAARSDGRGEASSDTAKASSTVAVSGMARDIGKASANVRATPDIRKEKVDAIKEQVDSGQYFVDGDKIAGKIIDDIIKQAR